MLSPQLDTLGSMFSQALLWLAQLKPLFRFAWQRSIYDALGSLQTVFHFGNKRAHTEAHKLQQKLKRPYRIQVLNLLRAKTRQQFFRFGLSNKLRT